MVKVAFVDDKKECSDCYLDYIKRYIAETHEPIETEVYNSGLNFLGDYKGDADIIFMDISMPHMNGLETARRLRETDDSVIIIFITTFSKYAIKGYEVGAMDFLVKPVKYELFRIKLEKAIEHRKKSKDDTFSINVTGGLRKVPVSEIRFIESDKHYLIFHTSKGELRTRGTMDVVKDFFLNRYFRRANRSLLVNLAYVEGYTPTDIIVAGESLSLSRVYKKEFINELTVYLGGTFK